MLRRAVGFLPLLLAAALAFATAVSGSAQEAPAWQPTGMSEPAGLLSTPSSGAFFTRVAGGLLRSDDGGASWAAVNVPAGLKRAEVDPTNHTIIYAAATGGLYKTCDDAASWQLVMPTAWDAAALAVSPADPNLVYLTIKDAPTNSTHMQYHRSRDGGASWELLEDAQASLCGFGVLILEPHPTDPWRVFRAETCFAGRTTAVALGQSLDQGETWSELFRPPFGYSRRLVGGAGAAPGRYYLAAERDHRSGGSTLYRSDDDGTTWSVALDFPNAFTGGGAQMVGPDINIEALAYDPANPDRIWLSVVETTGRGQESRNSYRLYASPDGGATWNDLGPDLGRVLDLAVGIDGANLYASGERGIWRLPL